MDWKTIGPIIGLIIFSFGIGVWATKSDSNIKNMQGDIKIINDKIVENGDLKLPSGAVMAFNLAQCPSGWATFVELRGRVIVGSGTGDGLSQRGLGETGGKETHTLTTDQMPNHNHYVSSRRADTGLGGTLLPYGTPAGNQWPTNSVGGGGAHNNMQPYMALLYCQKN